MASSTLEHDELEVTSYCQVQISFLPINTSENIAGEVIMEVVSFRQAVFHSLVEHVLRLRTRNLAARYYKTSNV